LRKQEIEDVERRGRTEWEKADEKKDEDLKRECVGSRRNIERRG
jgi:hypothetical protein